jgi:hypothetical protein
MIIDTLQPSPRPHARLTPEAATLVQRIQHEYREMPGLNLTEAQATRLCGADATTCRAVLATLLERGVLRRTAAGAYVRASD